MHHTLPKIFAPVNSYYDHINTQAIYYSEAAIDQTLIGLLGTQQFVLVFTAVKKSNMAYAKFVVLGPPMLGRIIEA